MKSRPPVSLRLCIILVATVLLLPAQEKGKIGEFDDAAKPAKRDTGSVAPAPAPSSNSSSSSEVSGEMSLEGIFFLAEATFYVVHGTILVTTSVLFQAPGEDSAIHDNTFWTRGHSLYPYDRGNQGMFSLESQKKFSLTASGEHFNDGGNLSGYGGMIRGSFHPAFAVEGAFADVKERLRTRTDHVRFYSFFVNYNRVRSERISVWWGLGIKGMSATTVHTSGIGFNLGSEVYPFSPMSLSVVYSAGGINGKTLHEFSTRLKYHYNRFAVSAGYRLYSIGGADLSGVTGGVSVHF